MPKPQPRPYRTLTPWEGFTASERPRKVPMPTCPSPACQRARACLSAHEGLYCQRTHMSRAEARRRQGLPPVEAPVAGAHKRLTHARVQVLAEIAALRLDEVQSRNASLTARWKAGDFDDDYGPYDSRGAWKHPPPRVFVP